MRNKSLMGLYMSLGVVWMMLLIGMIVIKLMNGVEISWFWTLSPLWIALAIIFLGCVFAVIKFYVEDFLRRKKYIKGNLNDYD